MGSHPSHPLAGGISVGELVLVEEDHRDLPAGTEQQQRLQAETGRRRRRRSFR